MYGSHSSPAKSVESVKRHEGNQKVSKEDERYTYLMQHGVIKRTEDMDKVIFAELPKIPGVLVVYRKPSERDANPERLNLDKRGLTHIPLLEGEEKLRLLNLQHNNITKIENLVSLPSLIFLDLYNNDIREISQLHIVPTLKVLMIGKNSIERIENLQSLSRLDVLDLHSNRITKIENLGNLAELRVLNLANNQITAVEGLSGLATLTELNLRRNAIEAVKSLAGCPKLQRLFLSNNRISRFEDTSGLADAPQLAELALDSNPICNPLSAYYKFCLKMCPALKNIDLKKVTPKFKSEIEEGKLERVNNSGENAEIKTEQSERKEANNGKKTQEDTKTEKNTNAPDNAVTESGVSDKLEGGNGSEAGMLEISQEKLMKVIAQEWHLEVAQLEAKYPNGVIDWKREGKLQSVIQSGHAEIEGDSILFIYGNALEVLSNVDFQKTVEQINFQYVLFDNIVNHFNLGKLCKFQRLSRLVFSYNYLNSFLLVSKLEALQHLTSLTIEHNSIAKTVLFKNFAIYRFNKLTHINGKAITEIDRQLSVKFFEPFNRLLFSSLAFKVVH